MKGEYVRTFTEDDLELQGLLCSPKKKSKTGVLHIHGLAGNFYENRFVDSIADNVIAQGYGFLTVNNRGHDYVSDFLKRTDSGLEWVQIGGAHELFEECIYDIRAWINFLKSRGYTEVILEGHSSGASKVVYYQSQTQDRRVKALILMSPSDDVGLQKAALGTRFGEALRVADEMLVNGKSNEFMPPGYFEYPIDAKSYINMFAKGTNNSIFNFSDLSRGEFKEIASIRCPMLAFLGTIGECVTGDIKEFLSTLKSHARQTRCDTDIIKDAPHNYLGCEGKIATLIVSWVMKVAPLLTR